MEHFASSVVKSSEDTSKSDNLLFNMDYDSGYISHNHESNLDSSAEINEKVLNTMNRPIYLSEDALLETPEVHKYANISLEIEKEDFEETRHVFSSPFLNNSSNEISASVASRDISYSGFETDQTNVSIEVPIGKQIIVDVNSVQNTKTKYSSPDLNDVKRELIRDIQQSKNLAFNNITNTLPSEPKKKLTLVFSKEGKENVFSVKRKYPSLTPDKSVNDSNGSFLLPTPLKCDNRSKIESENDSLNESTSFTSNSELSVSTRSEGNSHLVESSCMEESLSVILENESNCTHEISNNNFTDSLYLNALINESKSEKVTIAENELIEGDTVKTDKSGSLIACESMSTQQKGETGDEFREPTLVETQCEHPSITNSVSVLDKNRKSSLNDVYSDSSTEFAGFDNAKEENTSNNNKFDISESSKEENKELLENTSNITENSINLITSVVTETLEHVLKNVDHSDIKDLIFKKVNEALEITKNETAGCSKSIKQSPVVYKESKSWRKLSTNTIPSIASTPEKSGTPQINSSLSPDLFTEDIVEQKSQEPSQPVVSPPKERNVVKKDYMLLRRTQNNLKGVLPPRSLTVTQFSVSEMLDRLKCNDKYFWNKSTSVSSKPVGQSHSLLITCSEEEAKTKGFPHVLMDRCLGLHHNRSRFSEKIEDLCGRYGSRFVGAETQSSCTVFETHVTSPMKRRSIKPQWNTKSPGKRLSHLARRKITFSSSNLQSGNSFLAGSRARQILVDAKKMDLLSRRKSPRKSPRKTPRKTPGKSPRIKTRTPSSSAKKKLAMRFRKVTGEIENSNTSMSSDGSLSARRTLFHSPDDDKKLSRLLPSTSGSSLANEIKRSSTKRALFMSPSKSSPLKNMGFKRSPIKRLDFGTEKKRKRDDSIDEQPSKFARCHSENLPLSTLADVKTLSMRTKSELNISQNRHIKELTTNHKKKLQLAIYEALRSQNVLPTHPQFKVFASNLGRLTRKLFLMTTADCIGVTEKMLRIARHHVIAVVKGKSPEEIYDEFMKNKAKNLKPQGYVAPEKKPSTEKKDVERRPLVGKSNFNSESKVDRIRKAFNFGDDDNR